MLLSWLDSVYLDAAWFLIFNYYQWSGDRSEMQSGPWSLVTRGPGILMDHKEIFCDRKNMCSKKNLWLCDCISLRVARNINVISSIIHNSLESFQLMTFTKITCIIVLSAACQCRQPIMVSNCTGLYCLAAWAGWQQPTFIIVLHHCTVLYCNVIMLTIGSALMPACMLTMILWW